MRYERTFSFALGLIGGAWLVTVGLYTTLKYDSSLGAFVVGALLFAAPPNLVALWLWERYTPHLWSQLRDALLAPPENRRKPQ